MKTVMVMFALGSVALLAACSSGHDLTECKGPVTAANPTGAEQPFVWDDGTTTYFRFEGNQRMPSVYVVNPDGKEATVDYSVSGTTIAVHQTAQEFKLRDGDRCLCVFNQAFSISGGTAGIGTGTTSPSVVREIRP